MEWFENLQTVFDESHVVDGEPGKNVTMARRHGNEWFVGMLANNEGSEEELDLSFLDKDKTYLAYVYTDGGEEIKTATQVKCSYLLVKADETMRFALKPRGGAALRFVPADTQTAKRYKKYKGQTL